jgi:hypothetical protein
MLCNFSTAYVGRVSRPVEYHAFAVDPFFSGIHASICINEKENEYLSKILVY